MRSNKQVFQKVPAVIDQVCAEGLMATNRFVPMPPWESLLQGQRESDAWLLVEVEAGAPIGWCRLFSTGIPGEWELGIGLLSPYRNQGRGSRIVRQAKPLLGGFLYRALLPELILLEGRRLLSSAS